MPFYRNILKLVTLKLWVVQKDTKMHDCQIFEGEKLQIHKVLNKNT